MKLKLMHIAINPWDDTGLILFHGPEITEFEETIHGGIVIKMNNGNVFKYVNAPYLIARGPA